jgi:hypothetical protein
MVPERDETVQRDLLAPLEQAFITEFLERRGLSRASLQALPEADAHEILIQASAYASVRLAEVESRAHYVHDLHHTE